jgi:hypothetical protein
MPAAHHYGGYCRENLPAFCRVGNASWLASELASRVNPRFAAQPRKRFLRREVGRGNRDAACLVVMTISKNTQTRRRPSNYEGASICGCDGCGFSLLTQSAGISSRHRTPSAANSRSTIPPSSNGITSRTIDVP